MRYCSEACRIQHLTDRFYQHIAGCIPTEPLESSLALTMEPHNYVHSSARASVQPYWDRISQYFRQAPQTVPPLKDLFAVHLNVKHFTKAVAHRMPKNSVAVFFTSSLYEVKFRMRAQDEWASGLTPPLFTYYQDGDMCIRPTQDAKALSQRASNKDHENEVLILVVFVVDFDLVEDIKELGSCPPVTKSDYCSQSGVLVPAGKIDSSDQNLQDGQTGSHFDAFNTKPGKARICGSPIGICVTDGTCLALQNFQYYVASN